MTTHTDLARAHGAMPELPPIPPGDCIPYDAIRYIAGYPASYVQRYATEYAKLCLTRAAIQQAAVAVPEGMRLVPIEPTPAMLEASLRVFEWGWVEPCPELLECGVPVEMGITQEEAGHINAENMKEQAKIYAAMLAAAPQPDTGDSVHLGGGECSSVQVRESVAIALWHRFAPDHIGTFDEELHKAEYRAAADEVIALTGTTGQEWRSITTAPEGELVIVGWLDDEDTEHPERHMFDYLEDGVWQNYFNEHEHYLIAGAASGRSEDAPYTHWSPLSPIPAPRPDAPTSQIEEQAAFEEWLARVCPSGDVTEVQNQWLASSDYEEWASQINPGSAPREGGHGS